MDCPNESVLRAYLDRELDSREVSDVANHLESCAACQERFHILSSSALRVSAQLSSLDALPSSLEANPQMALARFKANLPREEQTPSLFARLLSGHSRLVWAVCAAAVVLFVSLMFPATRGFAQRLLATLRVEQVRPVNIDFGTTNTGANRQPLDTLTKLLSDSAVVTTDEKSSTAGTRDAASLAAGFPVRTLSTRTDAPSFEVSGAHAFHLTIDRSRLQDILDESGHPDLLLPATLEGATVSAHVPRAVAVKYGNCNKTGQVNGPSFAPSTPSNPCLVVIQAPSPAINLPSDLNLQQLAEIAFQLAGWSPEKAREFCQTVDWKSTLILPIPRTVQSYETVSINGIRGTLLHFPDSAGDRPTFALIWIDNAIIYGIIGKGDAASALQLASSLR